MEKGKLWMLIIIVILALMCVGFVIGFFVLTNTIKSLQTESGSSTKTEAPAQAISQADIEEVALEPIPSNLKTGEDGKDHLVQLTMQIGLNTKDPNYGELGDVIKAKTFAVSDLVTGILRMKTYEELKMDGSQDLLRDEILTKLQDYFQTNIIVQVSLVFVTD